MTILPNINNISGVNYFKELPFYSKPIEKPRIKLLTSIDVLTELPFYEQLSIKKKQIKHLKGMQCRIKLK